MIDCLISAIVGIGSFAVAALALMGFLLAYDAQKRLEELEQKFENPKDRFDSVDGATNEPEEREERE